jgi:uncharacterized protein YkwD
MAHLVGSGPNMGCRFRLLAAIGLGGVISAPAACSSARPASQRAVAPAKPTANAAAAAGSEERYEWARETRSPRPREARELEASCDEADAVLRQVAERIARRSVERVSVLDGPELVFALRAGGVPYVWPKVWSLEGTKIDEAELLERWQRWLGSFSEGGVRRCGAARATQGDRTVLVGVACDVLADLAPVPTAARVGQWLTIEAHTLSAANGAELVVLGPHGRPRAVPTSFHAAQARASFAVDRPGTWVVQLLAKTAEGPRPVAEAMVHAGTPHPTSFFEREAPGEKAAAGAADARAAIERMINAARASEGLARLRRDGALDRVADAHAEAMARSRLLGHDAGDGDPVARLAAAGIGAAAVAENVVHAATVPRAHRALWSSPSHRENLLFERFDSLGVGVVRDKDGSVWVCELFTRK